MKSCWMTEPVCCVTLGKFGDAMIMLPGMKAIHDATGIKPVFMISEQFASILEGVSYVQPWSVRLGWYSDVDVAYALARAAFSMVLLGKFWDAPNLRAPFKLDGGTTVSVKIHGRAMLLPAAEWDSYMAAQWRYSGFTMEQLLAWPLAFDRRSPEREEALRKRHFYGDKPKLLYNLSTSGSSPFVWVPEIMALLRETGFDLIDLSEIRAHRIYDLLGLYDHAEFLVTSDSAPLHLASASKIPYIAFVNNGGSGSIPKGNCRLKIRYADATASRNQVRSVLKGFANEHSENHRSSRDGRLQSAATRLGDRIHSGGVAGAFQGIDHLASTP